MSIPFVLGSTPIRLGPAEGTVAVEVIDDRPSGPSIRNLIGNFQICYLPLNKIDRYMKQAVQKGLLKYEIRLRALNLATLMMDIKPDKLASPIAGVGPDGSLMVYWNIGDRYIEFEIEGDHVRFFMKNAETGASVVVGPTSVRGDLPDKVQTELLLIP